MDSLDTQVLTQACARHELGHVVWTVTLVGTSGSVPVSGRCVENDLTETKVAARTAVGALGSRRSTAVCHGVALAQNQPLQVAPDAAGVSRV